MEAAAGGEVSLIAAAFRKQGTLQDANKGLHHTS